MKIKSRIMGNKKRKYLWLCIIAVQLLNFNHFPAAQAALASEQQFLLTDKEAFVATSTYELPGIRLSLPGQSVSTSSTLKLSALSEPLEKLTNAQPISQIYQVDFSEKIDTAYSVSLKYDTGNRFYKKIFFYDGNAKTWKPLPTIENAKDKTVSATVAFPYVRLAVFEFPAVILTGKASWYAYKGGLFAASPDFRAGTKLRVTNTNNPDKTVIVTVNDFGPDRVRHPERVVDLDKVAFAALAPLGAGVIDVAIEPLSVVTDNFTASLPKPAPLPVKTEDTAQNEGSQEDLSWVMVLGNAAPLDISSGELWQDRKTGGIFWVNKGAKAPLTDKIFLTAIFKNKKIFKKTSFELAKLKTLPPVRLPDGSLLKSKSGSTVYLIYKGQRRAFANGAAFEKLGYDFKRVLEVSDSVLRQYGEGQAISAQQQSGEIALTSRSAVVLDAASGKVLFAKNASEQLPLASLSKMVAMKVFLDSKPNLNEVVTYKIQDENYNYEWADKSVLARLKVSDGETLTVRNLLYSAVLGSANNAVESLVRVSGLKRDAFIARMNDYAKKIGAKQTKFVEPTGLSPQNMSSAYDYALLTKAVLEDGNLEKVAQTKSYSFTTINQKKYHLIKNSNSLFYNSNLKITASKTGYLDEAQYCLMTRARDEKGRQVIAVTLGTPSRTKSFTETANLINFGFKKYD
jgi:rare lipoprotein A (peptidoglycan hydrolase)